MSGREKPRDLLQLAESQTVYQAHAPQMQAGGPDSDEPGSPSCAGGPSHTNLEPNAQSADCARSVCGHQPQPCGRALWMFRYGTPRKTQAPQPKTESTTRANAGLVDANAILRWPEGTLIGWVF